VAAGIEEIRERVAAMLTGWLGPVEVDPDGDFTFRYGSARVFLTVEGLDDEHVLVRIFSPLVRAATESADLYRYAATHSFHFGTLTVLPGDGTADVVFGHSLLGNTLDDEELRLTVSLIAGAADDLDTEIVTRFGGETFYSEPAD
jgi:hypothetical protein